jgi:hypothetical protein
MVVFLTTGSNETVHRITDFSREILKKIQHRINQGQKKYAASNCDGWSTTLNFQWSRSRLKTA